jgi:hypothetical protein
MKSLKLLMLNNLKATQTITSINAPKNQDELFDFLLTFFEQLSVESAFLKELSTVNVIKEAPFIHSLTKEIFGYYIKTPYDHVTLNITLMSLFYAWQHDATADLSVLTHKINSLTQMLH